MQHQECDAYIALHLHVGLFGDGWKPRNVWLYEKARHYIASTSGCFSHLNTMVTTPAVIKMMAKSKKSGGIG